MRSPYERFNGVLDLEGGMHPDMEANGGGGRPDRTPFLVGVALSGAGLRAAIFHLGVIRRLEELGIMKNVDTISAVSGGSVVAAYYVREMGTRLRLKPRSAWHDTRTRVELFEEIARDFLDAVGRSLRTRTDLLQRDYDRWFYDRDTFEQLRGFAVTPGESTDGQSPEVLLISDASGQLGAGHQVRSGDAEVFLCVNEILQFQVRSKLIDRLGQWRQRVGGTRQFTFTHLFLDLDDRRSDDRMPAELIPPLARMRTQLDQFSFVEREALMYRGYTLIDAQIRKYCSPGGQACRLSRAVPLAVPPLFSAAALRAPGTRARLQKELDAGARKSFVVRAALKYPRSVGPLVAGWGVGLATALWLLFGVFSTPLEQAQRWIAHGLIGATSGRAALLFDPLLEYGRLPGRLTVFNEAGIILGAAALVAITAYVLAFPSYQLLKRVVARMDRRAYREIAGVPPTTHWEAEATPAPERPAVAAC